MASFDWFTRFGVTCDWNCHRSRGSLGGEDRAHPLGEPVLAPYDGVVTYGYYNDGASYVQIKYSNGYAHQAIHVQKGSRVASGSRASEGTRVAISGGARGMDGAGTSSGPHVHLQGMDPQGRRIPWRDVPAPYGQAAGSADSSQYAAPVAEIQTLANKLGATLDVDGNYGRATAGWVRAFQGDWGLTVDGIVGPATWAKMQEVARNAAGPSIRDVQSWLNDNLGAGLTVDGIDGPATQAAVKRYQAILGVAQDGSWGAGTEAAHREQHPANHLYGGAWVRSVQDKLNRLGYGPLAVDGLDGGGTRDAVKRLQSANGLDADGVAGPATNAKLDELLAAKPTEAQWPTDGRNATTRPTADVQRLVGADPDGVYGPATSAKVAQWQSANGLEADGIWGPASDAKGFPGVALPSTPSTPGGDSTYGKKTPLYPEAHWADVSPNKSPREGNVELFIVHHIGASSGPTVTENDRRRFMAPNDRDVSPNYLIEREGGASEIVPPDLYRAWTGGQIDHKAVTVETQNDTAAPAWLISDAAVERIADLFAWSARRYGIPVQRGEVAAGNVVTRPGLVGHRETPHGRESGTICPGPDMPLDAIVARAKVLYDTKYAPTAPPAPGTVLADRAELQRHRDYLNGLLGE